MIKHANKELLSLAQLACHKAQKLGCSAAAATVDQRREVEVVIRDGKKEALKSSESRGLNLRVFVDGRYGSHSISAPTPEALDRFVSSAVDMTRFLMPDTHRLLPDPALYKGRPAGDLGLHAPEAMLTMEQRIQAATRVHDATQAAGGGKLISVAAGHMDRVSEKVLVQSNGFSDGERSTIFARWAEASVQDPSGKKPSDWSQSLSRSWAGVEAPEQLGAEAVRRAVGSIGADKLPSCTLPLVIENRAVGRLLGGLLAPLSGQLLDRGQSCFEGDMDRPIAAPVLSITDDPLLTGGWGSRRFDWEGLTAARRPIIAEGVLKSFNIDTYYGKKLKAPPTSGDYSNLVFTEGQRDLDGLCAAAGEAILVTDFLGGNSNSTTGDFSHGIRGYLIEKGKRARPIAGMNISGNHRELWKTLVELGSDPYRHSSKLTPSMLFKPILFAGK